MIPTSIGDLAHTLVLRTRSVSIKTQIETLTQELASGQTTDIASRLDGDFAHLADMDRGLKRLAAFATSSAEAALFTDAVQDSLTNIHDRVDALSMALTSIGSFGQQINRDQVSNQAEAELQFILSSLNTSVGGRSLFAGMDTDRAPVAAADLLLSAVRTAVAGQTTPGDIVQAATDWFNDPAGFDAVIYAGSD
ncbi:MAG: flagellar biosynthesis protein FlgL, partial [Pseudomonadota bacterium]